MTPTEALDIVESTASIVDDRVEEALGVLRSVVGTSMPRWLGTVDVPVVFTVIAEDEDAARKVILDALWGTDWSQIEDHYNVEIQPYGGMEIRVERDDG